MQFNDGKFDVQNLELMNDWKVLPAAPPSPVELSSSPGRHNVIHPKLFKYVKMHPKGFKYVQILKQKVSNM